MGESQEGEGTQMHPLANYPKPPPRGEDLPCCDGEPLESNQHREQLDLLVRTLRPWKWKQPFFVGGNMFVYSSETQAKKNDFRGPDVFVVLGRPPGHRRSWVVWEEDSRTPDVVIELISPKTEKIDRGEKKDIYRDVLQVARYYLYDPFTYVLDGYARTSDGRYEPIAPDARGDLACDILGLKLGVRETDDGTEVWPMLRWITPEGRLLETPGERLEEVSAKAAEASARAEEVEARLEAERARVEALERRLAELEAKDEG